jgi:hypothetical protein
MRLAGSWRTEKVAARPKSRPLRLTDRGGKEAAYELKNGSCHPDTIGGHDPDLGRHIVQRNNPQNPQ